MEQVLREVCRKGLVHDDAPSVDIFDLDYLAARIDSLQKAFPEPYFLHAAAMKANSIRGILQVPKEKKMGAEGASICEVIHAINLGFRPEDVVYDSPCKTKV